MAPATVDYLEEILTAAEEFRAAEEQLYNLVEQAHRDGKVSWELIGVALGVSKQAAHKRFTKPPRGRLF